MHPQLHQILLPAFLCLASVSIAQGPSNWTTVAMPANMIGATNSIGTTVTFRTSTAYWLYSGITKRWTVLPVTNPQPIFQANDYCIIQDGNQIHGYASHTGRVETITTSGAPTIVSGPASSSWVTLVTDGLQAWGFGGFHGRWETVTLQNPNPTMLSNRLIGLLRDGSTVYGLNAHYGTFVPVAADATAVLNVVGEAEVGTAHSSGAFRAFSAQHNNWVTQAIPAGANLLQNNEYALAWAGTQIWGASGLTGTLASYTATAPISGVAGSEGCAGFVDGGSVVCFSSGRGQFVTLPATGATFTFKYHFALVVESGRITPFSAITGTFGAPILGTFTLAGSALNDEVAFANGGIPSYAYSAIRNAWTLAPLAITPTNILAVRDSIVLAHATGYEAFSARHGTWVSKTTGQTGAYMAPNTGSTFVAIDGASSEILHVFDARLNRWATATGQSALTIRISRHTCMAHDGLTAFGFGQPSSEWYAEPLTVPPTTFDTASSIGTTIHGTQLSVYSVQGSFSYTGRYPEFTQAINLGNTLRLHQVAPAGTAVFLGLGFAPLRQLIPGLGYLYIDASFGLTTVFWPNLVPADGILHMDLPVPNNPAFRGMQIHLQDFVVPPTGPAWLSTSVAPVLF